MPVKPRDEAAEVDPGGDAEDGGHVLGQDVRADGILCQGVRTLQCLVGGFGELQPLSQCGNMAADGYVVDVALVLQGVETCNFGDQIHDAVVAAGELAQAGCCTLHVLGAVDVGELRRLPDHRGAENVNPRGQSHAEWR